jgi:hypothetical protein
MRSSFSRAATDAERREVLDRLPRAVARALGLGDAPEAGAGTYRLVLRAGGETAAGTLTIRADPLTR